MKNIFRSEINQVIGAYHYFRFYDSLIILIMSWCIMRSMYGDNAWWLELISGVSLFYLMSKAWIVGLIVGFRNNFYIKARKVKA